MVGHLNLYEVKKSISRDLTSIIEVRGRKKNRQELWELVNLYNVLMINETMDL